MRFVKVGAWVLFTLFILAIAVALIGQNTEPLTVTLFTYTSAPLPKWVLLLSSLFLGALLASLFFIVELIVLETKNIRLRRENRMLIKSLELHGLKHGPSIEDEEQRGRKALDEDDLSDV
jgi:uncharacterized integral membrane protein